MSQRRITASEAALFVVVIGACTIFVGMCSLWLMAALQCGWKTLFLHKHLIAAWLFGVCS